MVGGRDVVIPSFLRDIHDSISMNHYFTKVFFACRII